MKEKNLFDRQNGDIRGRLRQEQVSTVVNGPMEVQDYNDYQYAEPSRQEIIPDTEVKDGELSTKEGGSSSNSALGKLLGKEIDVTTKAKPTLDSSNKDKKGFSAITGFNQTYDRLDEAFSFLDGATSVRIGAIRGDLQRTNKTLDDKLNYLKETVSYAKDMKAYKQVMDTAQDLAEFNGAFNAYQESAQKYNANKPQSDKYLQEMHESEKDINGLSPISKIKNSDDFIKFIDERKAINDTDAKTKIEDLKREQGLKRWVNAIYSISPEYLAKQQNTEFAWTDPSTWRHTLPGTMGSSFASIESMASSIAIATAANYLTKQLPTMVATGGMSALPGLALSVGAAVGTTWANIAGRQQESNAEVYDNYKSNLRGLAEQGEFDMNKVIVEGRKLVKDLTGADTSKLSDEEVLDDMLLYNVNTSDKRFNELRRTSREGLQRLYDKNMMLSVSDIGQAALVLPGVGTMYSKALSAVGAKALGQGVAKAANDLLDVTTKGIASKMSKFNVVTADGLKRVVKRGLTPAAKLGLDTFLEGNEEVVQYVAGKDYIAGKNKDKPSNWITNIAEDLDSSFRGITGVIGIGPDAVLNNDKELSQNFKLGAALGLFLGGAASVPTTVKEYVDEVAGTKFAKKLTAEHIKAKEDTEKIKLYATDALKNNNRKEAYFEYMEGMKEDLPVGLTVEDIDTEIDRAKKVFAMIDSPTLKATAKELNIDKGTDKYNTLVALGLRANESMKDATKQYNESKSKHDNLFAVPEVQEFFENVQVPAEQRNSTLEYVKIRTEQRGLEKFLSDLSDTKTDLNTLSKSYGFTIADNNIDDYIIESTRMLKETREVADMMQKDFEERYGKDATLYDRIDDIEHAAITSLPEVLVNALSLNQAIFRNSIYKGVRDGNRRFGKKSIKNAVKYITNDLNKYDEAQLVNAELNGQALEDDNIQEDPIVESIGDNIDEITNVSKTNESISVVPTIEKDSTPEKTIEETLLPEDVEESVTPEPSETAEVSDDAASKLMDDMMMGEPEVQFDEHVPESSADDTQGTQEEHVVEETPSEDTAQDAGAMADEALENPTETLLTEEDVNDLFNSMTIGDNIDGKDTIIPNIDNKPEEEAQPEVKIEDAAEEAVLNDLQEEPTDKWAEAIDENESTDATLGFTAGTVFFTDTPMFDGYEGGKAFSELLSDPNGLDNADVTIKVGNPGAKFNEKYVVENKDTWDEAAIYVQVEKEGKKYIGALRTISGAYKAYNAANREVNEEDINNLRKIRTQALEARLAYGPDAILKPNTIVRTNGKFNVNRDKDDKAIRRPIREIKGFNIPEDITKLEDDGLEFGIGRGARNLFYIVDKGGYALKGKGGSGKMYLYPRKSDVPSHYYSPPIKLNELRFSDAPDLVDVLYDSFVNHFNSTAPYELKKDGKTLDTAFTYMDITNFLINEGKHTLVGKANKDEFEYLRSKQFFFDRENDVYFIGPNIWKRAYLLTPKGKADFSKYVLENMHVNTNEKTIYEKLSHKIYSTAYFNKLDEIRLSESLVFDREDLGLDFVHERYEPSFAGYSRDDYNAITHLQYMVKHGWLLSDLNDQIFKSSFMYVKDIQPVDTPKATKEEVAAQAVVEQPTLEPTDIKTDTPFVDIVDDPEWKAMYGFDKTISVKEHVKARKINTEKAKAWLNKKLGLTDDQVIIHNGAIRTLANGGIVIGTTLRDSIVLSNAAVSGTEYHEAYHRVSTLLIPKAQRQKLYEEYRKRNPEYANASDKVVEEALAEGFRDFMLKRDKPLYSILKWFNPILTFVRKMMNIKPNNISYMYNSIAKGDFSNYRMDPEQYAEFEKAYPSGAFFTVGEGDAAFEPKAFTDLATYYKTIKSLSAALLFKNKVQTIEDVKSMTTSALKDYILSSLNTLPESPRRSALQEVYDHFDDVFMPDVMKEMDNIGIKAINKDFNKEIENKDSVNESTIQYYDKAAYEVSKKDNALGSAKLFIATMPKVYFKYTDAGDTKVRTILPEVDSLTGLPNYIDFDTSWNMMLNNLYNVETWQDLLDKTADRAESSPFFYVLSKRLSRVTDTNLQTQLLQTVKSNKHNMFTVKYGTKPSADGKSMQVYWRVDDSALDKALLIYPATWSQLFYNSNYVVVSEDGTTLNKSAIMDIKDEYQQIHTEISNKDTILTDAVVDNYIHKLVTILNKVGITVDKETIDSLLEDPKIKSKRDTRTSALYKLLTDTRNGSISYIFTTNLPTLLEGPEVHKTSKGENVRSLSNVFEGLGKNSAVSLLAKHYANVHPNPEELMVLGADNNLLYPISQNCYMSDIIRLFNEKPKNGKVNPAVAQLDQVTYLRNSLLKKALLNKKELKLNTFVNFKSEEGGDKGRDYMSISPIEDYLAKMTLTVNNHIVLPTMADKKMYFTITGVKLFNEAIDVAEVDGSIKVSFNDQVTSHINAIGLDELNAVIEYYNNKEKVSADKTLAVKNYHTKDLGGRFRHFTHIYKKIDGVFTAIDLNAELDKRDAVNGSKQFLEDLRVKLFSSKSDTSFVKETMNDIAKTLLSHELKSATDLGIIKKGENGVYSNLLLDQSLLDDYKNVFVNRGGSIGHYAEHYAILSIIGNNAINTAVSIIEVEKLFTGDPAFYKNTDDKIKRLSSVLSTGDNLRTDWPIGHRLENRKEFTATELNDNEIQSAQYNDLLDMFTKSYTRKYIMQLYDVPEQTVDAEMQKSDAKEKYKEAYNQAELTAARAVNGYGLNKKGTAGNINQADAAVYISPQMYKDIVEMLGEWSPEVSQAYDLMESDTDWLNDPKAYEEALQTLIKPLKMMYYGQSLVPELNIQVPIFDKMAMFPMFKVLATGDNKVLYERMTASGEYASQKPIDMVAFGSAVKAGSRAPLSFYTDHTNTQINDLSKMSVFSQDFRFLRRQLVTDPHHAERQMLGTQVAKAAVSNLVLERIYGEGKDTQYTGRQIKNNLFGTMNALSNLGADRLKEQLFKDDEIDVNKLSEMLVRDAKSSNMGSEVIGGMRAIDGKFDMPLSALSDNKWIASRVTGMFNKEVIDINMPGGAFIQMSSFGFKSIKTAKASAYNQGERLKYVIKNGKAVGSMDSIVSINLFAHMIPNYKRLSFIQAKQWLIDNNIIGTTNDVSPVAMGYRIPTQGLSSISSLRIVDVLPANVGDTVILPDEFTALTGSDFDIDKLYIARYNYETYEDTDGTIGKDGLLKTIKKARKVQFDWDKSTQSMSIYDANSREANENLLLDMYMAVLTDSKNVDETRLPLDNTTAILKDEILPIVDGPDVDKSNYSFMYVSPTYQLNKKYEYSGGKSGIAPFALNNVHHVLTQLTNLSFKPSKILKKFGFGDLNKIDSRDVQDYERDKYGKLITDAYGNRTSKEERGERILDWLSAMINAHVDVAKDPYIIRLNVVQWTYNMADFLLRSGFGKDTFFFLPQPILKDMALAVSGVSGKYGVDSKKSRSQLEKEAIQTVKDKYYAKALSFATPAQTDALLDLYKGGDNDSLTYVLDRSWLIDQLNNSRKDEKDYTYYYNQLAVFATFEQLTPYAQELSELVHLSQVDTKKFGNNFALQQQFIYRVKDFILNNNVFRKKDLIMFYRNTFLDTKIKNGIITPSNVFKDLMLTATDSFNKSFRKVLQLIGQSTTKDETTLKIVSNELEALIKGRFFSQLVNDKQIDVKDLFYGSNSMAKRLSRFKTSILVGEYPELLSPSNTILNEFLNYITPEFKQLNDVYDSPDVIVTPATKSNDKYLQERLTKYWEELLASPHENVKKFAEDLVVYAFYTSGDNFNKNSFFNLVPNSYRKEIGYAAYIEKTIQQFNGGDSSLFLDSLFVNTWYNNNLVRETKIDRGASALYSSAKINDTSYPLVISGVNKSQVIGFNAAKQPIFKPYIKHNLDKTNNPETTLLYKYVGYHLDETGEIEPIYHLVNKKGLYLNGKVVREYNTDSSSILSFNSVPYLTNTINLFEIEEYLDKAGNVKKRFKNISVSSKTERDKWKNIIDNTNYIDDFTVKDVADERNYDEIMNMDISEEADEETEESSTTDNNIVREVTPDGIVTKDNVFTFKDGFEIETPFQLNNQQSDALSALEDFVSKPSSYNNEITLTGYAGTGKTTIMGFFDKYLRHKYISPIYSAVTYRANAVTKMNNPNAQTYTLHQLFGISAEVDLTDANLDLRKIKNEQKYKPKLERGMYVIIDEASMVSNTFYDFIKEYKDALGIRVIYVGDPAQLAPVGEEGMSPVFNTDNGKVLSLTKVMRTGDNPILEEATNLRNGKDLSYVTKVNADGEGVVYTNSEEEANSVISNAFKSEQFKENKLYFRALSATNDRIPVINNMVRRQLFGDNAKQIEVGDILMGYDNWGRDPHTKSPKVVNSGDYEVTSVTPLTVNMPLPTNGDIDNTRTIRISGFEVILKDILNPDKAPIGLMIADNDTPQEIIMEISKEIELVYRNISRAYRERQYNDVERNQGMLETIADYFTSMKDYTFGGKLKIKKLFDYGYAHTIHKSQGGTYNQVLIYADTIDRFQSHEARQQLKYVAVSRAKGKVTILTNKKLGIKEEVESTDKFAQLKQEESQGTVNSQDVDIDTLMSSMITGDLEVLTSGDSLMDLTANPQAEAMSREQVIAERRKQLIHLMQEHESLGTALATERVEEAFENIIAQNENTDTNTLNNKLLALLCQY